MIEIRYSAHGWVKEQRPEGPVDVQQVWVQLENDEWLSADLIRLPAGFGRQQSVFCTSAWIKREPQPNGGWRSSTLLANSHNALHLIEDPHVRNTTRPAPPAAADNVGSRYIAARGYAVPGKQK